MTSNELKHKAKLQEWALTVQECRSSGKPVKQWCIENKIKATTYSRREGTSENFCVKGIQTDKKIDNKYGFPFRKRRDSFARVSCSLYAV